MMCSVSSRRGLRCRGVAGDRTTCVRVASSSSEEGSDHAEGVDPAADPPRLEPKRGHDPASDSDFHQAGLFRSEAGNPDSEVRWNPSKLEQGCPRRRFHSETIFFSVEADFVVADQCGDIGRDVQGLDH
ncbi:MAG: hypothetical protein CMJ54_04940 [Planctomycetaceae bacterium]|nr:hypothetical protein [Planctomycetaceae bacterium]